MDIQELREMKSVLVEQTMEYDQKYIESAFLDATDMMLKGLGFARVDESLWTMLDGSVYVKLIKRVHVISGTEVFAAVEFGLPSGAKVERYGYEEKEINSQTYLNHLNAIKDEIYRILVAELKPKGESVEDGVLGEFHNVARKHQLKIAVQTLKMPKAIADVMGGPSHESAIVDLMDNGFSEKDVRKFLKQNGWKDESVEKTMKGAKQLRLDIEKNADKYHADMVRAWEKSRGPKKSDCE